ncbi:MAG: YgjP-like metallopeptidase domain-containing protein [Candidatus Altiarchaeota archaeon]|nr:YgjP-like metallopeptidase domain-containing protein [Candidatus Altiarchaeota archaeon]
MEIKVIRSNRRRKTVSVREVDGVIHLRIPAGLLREEEERHVKWAKRRFRSYHRRKELEEGNLDGKLDELAEKLNKKYFGGGLSWKKIGYSTEQNSHMYGNCNVRDKTIRVSDRLLKMPGFVHDYVVVHELAHLKIPKHNKEFWRLVNQYPKTERARGYLMAVGMSD